MTEALICSIAS
ncbi:unnamed protein product [Thlaspi arvense]|uniref:Uncharacterized protein n=1 Tax=Thlaspi arvense TaxID=13288 RepID=A0AAU9SB65_THLAR|nr:unnamed protein product [Thlaspi arvense]